MTEGDGGLQKAIVGRAKLVASGTLLSRLLGLVREQVLAALFSRRETDAYNIAFQLPNLLRQLLAEGAVQTGVLPVLAATRESEGDEAARQLMQKLRGLSLLLLALVSVAGVVFAPTLVSLFASGYRQEPGKFELTVQLTRWLFPYIFFMGSAALGVAALNTYHRYVVTAFAPALLNVCFVGCALSLPAAMAARGWERTMALAVGVGLGGASQVVAQWPSLRAIGMLRAPRLDLRDEKLREVLRRLGPALLGIGVYYLDVIVGRRLLTDLPEGSLTYFSFALRLCDFPQGIFIMALQAATLPSLSRLAVRGDTRIFAETVGFGLRLSLFVALPASVMLTALAEPVVVAIFQRGEFGALAARETGRALAAQAVGVWMVACVRQLVSAHYALGDTRGPAWISAVDFGVFVLLALGLRGPLGHVGISWAVTGASFVQVALLAGSLQRRLPGEVSLGLSELARAAGSALLASGPASVAAVLAARAATVEDAGPLQRILPAACGGGAFGVLFLVTARAVGNKELQSLIGARRRRLPPPQK